MVRSKTALPALLKRGFMMRKYRIEKRIGDGRFAHVYQAYDTIEGVRVALKVFLDPVDGAREGLFRHEARMAASLDHPNIVRLKTAEIVGGAFVLVTELGERTLAEALERPRSVRFAIHVLEGVLRGLAHAHQRGVIHRDIKPENILVWRDGRVKVADFGISRLADMPSTHTTSTGTPSYRAPEQAYGRPAYASDVFAVALVFYEMVARVLPRWPLRWPFERAALFESRVSPALVRLTRRAASFDLERRYSDAGAMLAALQAALPELQRRNRAALTSHPGRLLSWREYRKREFEKRFERRLALEFRCHRCSGPISEFMAACPWCGYRNNSFEAISTLPSVCSGCERGVHEDWRYCPWCYGAGFRVVSGVPSRDARYGGRCPNPRCRETRLLPHMKHCPWCNARLRPWRSRILVSRCTACRASVAADYWDFCAWCGKNLLSRSGRPRRSRKSGA